MLHVRDTDADAAEFAGYNLTADKMDIALLPCWLLQSKNKRAAIRQTINPDQVVAVHVPRENAPANDFGSSRSRKQLYLDLEAAWPGIILMREPMETREVGKQD